MTIEADCMPGDAVLQDIGSFSALSAFVRNAIGILRKIVLEWQQH